MTATLTARKTHIDQVRDGATNILATVDKLANLKSSWDAGMGTWITDGDDFAGVEGVDKAAITAVYTTLAALEALLAQGHRTNLEKVRK